MFVWGGQTAMGSGEHFADGALYFPATKTWRALPQISVADYQWAWATWTGSQVVLLTAATFDRPGAGVVHMHAFDPVANRWSALPDLTAPNGHTPAEFVALNAGDTVYLWSLWEHVTVLSTGSDGLANSTETKSGIDGYSLDLHTGKWSSNKLGTPLLKGIGPTFWTGDKILAAISGIWCGSGCSPPPYAGPPGALLDPIAATATTIPQTTIGWSFRAYVWTGRALLGFGANGNSRAMAAWDPETGAWTPLAPPPVFPEDVAVWTGHELLLWGATDSHGQVAGLRFGP
jgi:hypothetical protein